MSVPDSADRSNPNREVFDREELLSSIHGDRELLDQFVQLFLRDFPPKIQQLRAVAPASETDPDDTAHVPDTAALRDAAHKILGSARTMRLHRLARAAGNLQRVVDTGEYVDHDLIVGVNRVVDEYHAVVAVLKR